MPEIPAPAVSMNMDAAMVAQAVADWMAANPRPANAVLVGQVQVGQSALVAIALGIREVTVDLAGTVPGERYLAFCRSFKLNGAATSTPGRPASYTLLDVACNTAGKITVSINAPLLAIGASYALAVDIMRLVP